MKRVGIIGGMGPLATVDLLGRIVSLTQANTDQEHIHVIVDSNTAIPDRTSAILHSAQSPVPQLLSSALRLEAAGAQILAMACNTAHYFYDSLQPHLKAPMLHMIRETAREAANKGCKCVGLLATIGTIRSGVYAKAFQEAGIDLLLPDAPGESAVMDVIYKGVKTGWLDYPDDGIRDVLNGFLRRGARFVVLGCTELPIYFSKNKLWEDVLDSTDILARRLIEAAGGSVRA